MTDKRKFETYTPLVDRETVTVVTSSSNNFIDSLTSDINKQISEAMKEPRRPSPKGSSKESTP